MTVWFVLTVQFYWSLVTPAQRLLDVAHVNALFGYNKIWAGMEVGESLFKEWGETNQANVEEKLRRER